MVRDVRTRTLRATSPTRHRLKQYICDGRIRLVRKRPQLLRPDFFEEHRDELWKLQEEGILEVRVGSQEGPAFNFGEKAEPKEESGEQVSEEEPAADDGGEGEASLEGSEPSEPDPSEAAVTPEPDIVPIPEEVEPESKEEPEAPPKRSRPKRGGKKGKRR